MAKVLVVYASIEGQTYRIARFVVDVLREAGFEANVGDADDLYRTVRRGDYDAVIVGASVHHDEHPSSVVNFVRDHLELLNELPTAFFSVSLNAAIDDPERRAEAERNLRAFLDKTTWQPDRTRLVAGALRNTELDYFRRELARYIVTRTLGQVDTGVDYEFTDFEDVRQFVRDFLEQVVTPRLAANEVS